ncbi:hypothetical protein Jiend_61980 [Micromonospora endophytica]|nr:hypothetical protein [Micromonospora endophytica]RIW42734.1 hypothetical protein D3H59_22115 [Micromonospora endophytica]BCJ62776.1 hypothetical protein Jiend_61980 [Micromonospora endophytica]
MEVVLRPGPVALDLTGQAVPDGDVPGRFRRVSVEHVVPELRLTSGCDGAEVYERPEERPAGRRNVGAGRCERGRAGAGNRGRFASAGEESRTAKCPDRRADRTFSRATWAGLVIRRCLRAYRR